jgi:arylsulfatase A-like enzyme
MRSMARAGWSSRPAFAAASTLLLVLLGCVGPLPLETDLALEETWLSGLQITEPHRIDLGTDDGSGFLGLGWYYGEIQKMTGDSFVWSHGSSSEIFFHLGWQRDLVIELCGRPFHWPGAPAQTISLELNGIPITEITDLAPGHACTEITLTKASEIVGRNQLVALYGRVNRPSDVVDRSTDDRDLAFAWSEIIFHGVDATPIEITQGTVFMPAGSITDHFIDLAPGSTMRIDACESAGEAPNVLSISILTDGDPEEATHTHRCSGEAVKLSLEDRSGLSRLRFSTHPDASADAPTGVRLRGPVIIAPPPAQGPEEDRPLVSAAQPRGRRPNVIIYLVDALRADRLGTYGCSRPLSPRLDAMAAEGVTFTDVTAQSSWTKAAVASIFTGYRPRAHGVNGPDDRLPDHLRTLPEFLQAEGYQTGAVVANAYVGEPFGFGRGFDSFEFIEHTRGRSDVIHGRLEEWFAARGDDPPPFFLYVHTIDPHAPYAPPAPFFDEFASSVEDPTVGQVETVRGLVLGTVEPTRKLGDDLRHLYDAEVAANDFSFGRLLDLLGSTGELDNTLVIFTSDHGEAFGEHGHWTHGLDLYNEVLAVPLVMRLPGAASPGLRVTEPVQHIDLLPTVLESCGIRAEETLPGAALLSDDGPAPIDPNRAVVASLDYWGRTGATVLRNGWKLIQPLSADFGSGIELYRHDSDPTETLELSADRPVRRGWLESTLTKSLKNKGSSVTTEVDPEVKEQLEALGYMN